MAPPKKTVKMDLSSFLNDDSFGNSWAEDEVDLNKINIPIQTVKPSSTIPLEEFAPMGGSGGAGKGSRLDPSLVPERKERIEYPVPDHPPFRAVINNLPWDVSEDGIKAWFEDGLQQPGSVEEVAAPRDFNDPSRLKGFAFVTLADRKSLEESLKFNATKLNERTVYVSVAAPPKDGFRGDRRMGGGGFEDFDWGSARGSNFHAAKPRREDPDLDWGVARGSNFQAPRERQPRREEPDLDWGAVRGANFSQQPRRERKPRSDEPQLDWGSARGSNYGQQQQQQQQQQKPRRSKFESAPAAAAEEKPKIQKSAFEVLAVEDDEPEHEQPQQHQQPQQQKPAKSDDVNVTKLEKSAAQLSLETDDDEWEVVGKK